MRVPARPTLALLRALTDDWTIPTHRSAIQLGREIPGRLHELGHPIVSHAAATFVTGGDQAVERESISGLTNPAWWKVKTGRWRGAVYEDPQGIFWLCAAGLRRERERTDFYRQFMADVERLGPEQYLPKEEDYARLRLEQAESRLHDWEVDIHRAAGEAFAAAVESGRADFTIPSLAGETALCHVKIETVEVPDEDPDESLVEVLITVRRLDWSQSDLADEADIVVMAAIERHEQAWDFSSLGADRIYTLLLTAPELRALVGDLDPDAEPGCTTSGDTAHYTHRGRLTEARVKGEAVRSLCGTWFVPLRDGGVYPTCPACETIHRHLPPGSGAESGR